MPDLNRGKIGDWNPEQREKIQVEDLFTRVAGLFDWAATMGPFLGEYAVSDTEKEQE